MSAQSCQRKLCLLSFVHQLSGEETIVWTSNNEETCALSAVGAMPTGVACKKIHGTDTSASEIEYPKSAQRASDIDTVSWFEYSNITDGGGKI